MNNSENIWNCPVCKASSGTSGPFVSDWAVACHIAGKARTGDRLHKSWALSKISNLDVRDTLPRIAERLTWAVVEAQKEQDIIKESSKNQRIQEPYNRISTIERRLHKFIENALKREFGESEQEWWVQGIPLTIRQECQNRCEADNKRQDAYSYTYLLDLQSILNKNWRLFEANFQRISKQYKLSKNELLNNVGKLNEIRNIIMHPVRQQDELSEEAQFLDWFDRLTEEFCRD